MSGPYDERRREPREETGGSVEIHTAGPPARRFKAELVDTSRGGFRARYPRLALETGQRVSFRHDGGDGEARVVWTRITVDHQESGFLVL